jgi:hypothetical protein
MALWFTFLSPSSQGSFSVSRPRKRGASSAGIDGEEGKIGWHKVQIISTLFEIAIVMCLFSM